MSRLIATRISDEAYSKIMGKCSGLGCSVYDYLKMLVETDLNDTKEAKRIEEKRPRASEEESRRINERIERLVENIKRREAERATIQR